MNKLISVSAAGALGLGAVAAHASIPLPSSGSSDAILFAEVVNAAGTAAVASYAGDTGVSVNSILSGSGSGTYFASDAKLAALFAADGTGDSIYFAVLGGQSNGGSVNTAGNAQFITSVLNNSTTTLASKKNSALTLMYTQLNQDLGTVNSNAGGASSVEGSTPATSGVWDITNTGGTAYWGGAGISNANLSSVKESLYYVTGGGGGNLSALSTPLLEGTASLSSSGLVISAVPLPPAVWLFGSGLLGLAGVSRRRAKA
jgi:hypothetical protein